MDEILVHVSAPSTAHDDARYRAQVAAIRHFLLTADSCGDHPGNQSSGQRQASDLFSASDSLPGHPAGAVESFYAGAPVPSPGLDLCLHSGETQTPVRHREHGPVHEPQLIPADSATKEIAPHLDRLATIDGNHQDPDSLESLVSVIPDSQPDLFNEQSCLRSYLPSIQSQETSAPKRRRLQPCTPAINSSTSATHEGTISPPDEHGNSKAKDKNATRSSPAPAPAPAPNVLPIPIATSASTSTPPSTSPSTSPTASATIHLLKPLPQEIHPPPPPISTAPFTTHITPTLSMLTERLNPARTYRPLHQTRDLDTLERGYWAVRINIVHSQDDPEAPSDQHDKNDGHLRESSQRGNWSAPLFCRFWTFLAEFIGKDARAGWGVWCILDRDDIANSHLDDNGARAVSRSERGLLLPSTTLGQPPDNAESGSVTVLLKVYAWGEVAMHVFLLLFLASERRVRGMGVQWRDSREEVVIQMP